MGISRILFLAISLLLASGCSTLSTVSNIVTGSKIVKAVVGEDKEEEVKPLIKPEPQLASPELPKDIKVKVKEGADIKERMVPPDWLIGIFIVSFVLMLINTIRQRLKK